MATLKSNYLVAKRNVLNEIRANNMTLQELRFFSIYLAKINPKDLATRIVSFSIEDFRKIMEITTRVKINGVSQAFESLLSKVVKVPTEEGGFDAFQLFKKCRLYTDNIGKWYVEIDAHDDALPLMFEFKEKYFTYQLWNALRLKSPNQLRMYEILKQYERLGERIISVDELKELLGIDKKEYSLYKNFRLRVLDACQKALAGNTDITFTYEPTGLKGKGGKILTLKFKIEKNKNHTNQLSLEEFIEQQPVSSENDIELSPFDERLNFLAGACNDEFKKIEMQIIHDLLIKALPSDVLKQDTEVYQYLKRKYDELLWRAEKTKITHRFNYLKKMLEADII